MAVVLDAGEVEEHDPATCQAPASAVPRRGKAAFVEQVANKVTNVGMHAVLLRQHALLVDGQLFKEILKGVARQQVLHFVERQSVADVGIQRFAGHGGRQLVVIPHHHHAACNGTRDHQLRTEGLAGLVDDGDVERAVPQRVVAPGHADAGDRMHMA
ncbi:hypothetical protein D3C71_1067290 [compost metagenome]